MTGAPATCRTAYVNKFLQEILIYVRQKVSTTGQIICFNFLFVGKASANDETMLQKHSLPSVVSRKLLRFRTDANVASWKQITFLVFFKKRFCFLDVTLFPLQLGELAAVIETNENAV